MAKRVKIGDIVEFKVGGYFSYALFTHKHPMYGALLRINNTQFKERLTNFIGFFDEYPPSFSTFFPLQVAFNKSLIDIVDNIEIQGFLKKFPIFRCAGGIDFINNKVKEWYLWDGENEKYFGKITPEIKKFPTRGTSNDTYIIEKIKQNWRDEDA